MKEIQLTQGKVALVDDDDFERINHFKWCTIAKKSKHTISYYAGRNIKKDDGKKTIQYLHHFISGKKKGFMIDHKDGDGLNNQKNNLRICTTHQNAGNSIKTRKKCASLYKGVTIISNREKKYTARIRVNYKVIFLGNFFSEIEAAEAYNKAAKKYFGEFARLNIIK